MEKKKLYFYPLLISFFLFAHQSVAAIYLFVSFSMPETLLSETLREASSLNIPSFLNGLYKNSLKKTIKRVLYLTKKVPTLNLQIDPILFSKFSIQKVPALVVANEKSFDVIYGNLSLKESLKRIAGRGDSGLTIKEVKEIIHDT